MQDSLILINPWIYDFAAYDLWSKPLGLLYLASYLRDIGFKVNLIDCLDVDHPQMKSGPSVKAPKRRLYGTGKYFRQEVKKPPALKDIKRQYSRYGIAPSILEHELKKVSAPSAVLITSIMTYWYPGVQEVIRLVKRIHPGTPVILGGVYSILCSEHAAAVSGADLVYTSPGLEGFTGLLEKYGVRAPAEYGDGAFSSYPAFDLLTKINYVCIRTSSGCPYRCKYCASHMLSPIISMRDPDEVVAEILYWNRNFLVRDFAFYDDALLFRSDTHFALLLEKLAKLKLAVRFHTPNALHAAKVDDVIAGLMKTTGFRTIRLGLETSDLSLHRSLGDKISEGEFERAVKCFINAGFSRKDIGAYILMGLPGQSIDSVYETIEFVKKTGAFPYLSEYSPIPKTALWEKALKYSEYDLSGEPLFHNNTLLSCWSQLKREEVPRLKRTVLEIRQSS